MTETLLIWGAGGDDTVVAELAESVRHAVAVFADRDPAAARSRLGARGRTVPVLDERDLLTGLRGRGRAPDGTDAVALGIGDDGAREAAHRALEGIRCPPLVHPTAVVSATAVLDDAAVVMAAAVVQANARVGGAVILNTGAIVEHDCAVGHAAHISPGGVLSGGVRVGARSRIGAGAVVIHGVTIDADAVVGAGAVIIRDVPDGATVVGNPGRTLTREAD